MTATPAAPAPVSGPQAQRAARDVLHRPQFRHGGQNAVSRAWHWLLHHLDRLFSGAGGTGDHAVLLVVVVLVVVAVVFAVRAGRPALGAPREPNPAADPLAPVTTARDHRRLAAQFAAEGRRADALREWLRAAVRTIEERGVLEPLPGRTGAGTAREAGPLLPTAAGDLAAATAAFDEIWFGGRAATDADVARGQLAADAVAAAAISPPAAHVPDGLARPW